MAGPIDDPSDVARHAVSPPVWRAGNTITRDRARPLRRIVPVARETALMEAWRRVHVLALRDEWQVWEHAYDLPQAATQRALDLGLDLSPVARAELRFADPVPTDPRGDRVWSDVVNPGYGEIKLEWAERER